MRAAGADRSERSTGRGAARDSRARIVLDLEVGSSGWTQRLADLELWCDRPVLPDAQAAPRPALVDAPRTSDPGALVYDGPGGVGGRLERVQARVDRAGYRTVEFERGERFRISPAGERIEKLAGAPGPSTPELESRQLELAVGAPLALALALHEILLLHAAALERSGVVVALVGASGAGKSTLAEAGHRRCAGWRRAADDILPVRPQGPPLALPAYPQLKLPANGGWDSAAPARLPLAAVVELDRFDSSPGSARVALEPTDPARGAETLIRATVAARLFDEPLLAWHFDRIAAIARATPVWRLRYPSGRDGLAAALDRLERMVEEGGGGPEIP